VSGTAPSLEKGRGCRITESVSKNTKKMGVTAVLSQEEILKIFKNSGALWEGHFVYTSGLHGNKYIQCARVSQFPEYNELLCKELAGRYKEQDIDVVLGAAVGGIIICYELARQLSARSVFAERVEGKMTLRRGLEINEGERVLLVEDVVTTGGTVKELVPLVESRGGIIVGGAAFVNRNPERVKFDFPFETLLSTVFSDYPPEECPLCKEGIPFDRPGSRTLAK
jgi:orotate phosphoribosyltransferase